MQMSQKQDMEELEGDAVVRVTKNSRAGLGSWLDKARKGSGTLEGAVDIAATWETSSERIDPIPDCQQQSTANIDIPCEQGVAIDVGQQHCLQEATAPHTEMMVTTPHQGNAQQQQQQEVNANCSAPNASQQLPTDGASDASLPRHPTDDEPQVPGLGPLMNLLVNCGDLSQLPDKFSDQAGVAAFLQCFQQPQPYQEAEPSAAASNATRHAAASTAHFPPAHRHAASTEHISPEPLLDTPFAHCMDLPFGDCSADDVRTGKDPSCRALQSAVAALGSADGGAMPSMDWSTMQYPHACQPDDRCRTPSPRQQGDGSFSPPGRAAVTGLGARTNGRPSPPAMQSSSKKPDVATEPITPTRCSSPSPRLPNQQAPQGRRQLHYHAFPVERHGMPAGRVMSYPHAPPGYMPRHHTTPHLIHHPQYPGSHPTFQPPTHLHRQPSRFARLNTGDAAAAHADDGPIPTQAPAPTAGTSRRSSASTGEALGAVSGPQRVVSDSSCDASSGHAPRPGTSARPAPQYFAPHPLQPGYYYPRHHYPPFHPPPLQRPHHSRSNSCAAERDGGMPSMSGCDLRASAPEQHMSMRAHAAMLHHAHPPPPQRMRQLPQQQQQQQQLQQQPLAQKRRLVDRDRLAPSHSAPPGALHGFPWMPPPLLPAGARLAASQDVRWYMREAQRMDEAKRQLEKEIVILKDAMKQIQDEDEAPIGLSPPMAMELSAELLRIRQRLERRSRRRAMSSQELPAGVGPKVGDEVIDAAMLGKLSAAYAAQPGEENREKAQTAALAAAALASAERAEQQLTPPSCYPERPAERALIAAAKAPAPRSPKRRVLQYSSSTGATMPHPQPGCYGLPILGTAADDSSDEMEMFLNGLLHDDT